MRWRFARQKVEFLPSLGPVSGSCWVGLRGIALLLVATVDGLLCPMRCDRDPQNVPGTNSTHRVCYREHHYNHHHHSFTGRLAQRHVGSGFTDIVIVSAGLGLIILLASGPSQQWHDARSALQASNNVLQMICFRLIN